MNLNAGDDLRCFYLRVTGAEPPDDCLAPILFLAESGMIVAVMSPIWPLPQSQAGNAAVSERRSTEPPKNAVQEESSESLG